MCFALQKSQVEHMLLVVMIVFQHIPQHLNYEDTSVCYKMLIFLQRLEPLLPLWKVPNHLAPVLVHKTKHYELCCHLVQGPHKNHRHNVLKEDMNLKGG